MIDYIKGEIIELTPTDIVLECHGIGYNILISVQTYSALDGKKEATVYIHHYLREDEELYYGFATKEERKMFRLLIGVSGVGAATARMMLSSLSVDEIQNAILSEDVNRIKSVKGIGLKSAQRLILELKDKVVKGGETDMSALLTITDNKASEEATTALIMLGFTKVNVNKAVNAVLKEDPTATVENIIRKSLQKLS
jgi:Holliday junction DNA helicase RuvA